MKRKGLPTETQEWCTGMSHGAERSADQDQRGIMCKIYKAAVDGVCK